MATLSLVQAGDVPDPGDTEPRFVERFAATLYPAASIVALHRMNNANPQTTSLDDVTSTSSSPSVAGAGAVAALSGGGVRLTDRAQYPVKTAITLTDPWTFGFSGQMRSGAGGTGAALFATSLYHTTGLIHYSTQTTTTSATRVSLSLRCSVEGAPSGAVVPATTSAAFLYDTPFVAFLSHVGAGVCELSIWIDGGPVAFGTLTFDPASVHGAGGGGSLSMFFCAGCFNGTFTKTDTYCEGMGLWGKVLSLSEKTAAYAGFAADALTHGRPL